MALVDTINWDNMPEESGPQYPALLTQLSKCHDAAREERLANEFMALDVFIAMDWLRLGVTQLTGVEIDPPSSVTEP